MKLITSITFDRPTNLSRSAGTSLRGSNTRDTVTPSVRKIVHILSNQTRLLLLSNKIPSDSATIKERGRGATEVISVT